MYSVCEVFVRKSYLQESLPLLAIIYLAVVTVELLALLKQLFKAGRN